MTIVIGALFLVLGGAFLRRSRYHLAKGAQGDERAAWRAYRQEWLGAGCCLVAVVLLLSALWL